MTMSRRQNKKTLTDWIEFSEIEPVYIQKKLDKANLCQRFLQNSYEQIESLESGRNKKLSRESMR